MSATSEVFEASALGKDQAFEETVSLAKSKVVAAHEAKLNDNALVKLREAVTEKKLGLKRYFPGYAKPDAKDPNADILATVERNAAGTVQLGLDLKGATSFLLSLTRFCSPKAGVRTSSENIFSNRKKCPGNTVN